jgi:hypothetical protein
MTTARSISTIYVLNDAFPYGGVPFCDDNTSIFSLGSYSQNPFCVPEFHRFSVVETNNFRTVRPILVNHSSKNGVRRLNYGVQDENVTRFLFRRVFSENFPIVSFLSQSGPFNTFSTTKHSHKQSLHRHIVANGL